MAKLENGINGAFSGVVGTVVGAKWKGIPYMRSKPKKRTGKISSKENANRKKFAMAHAWLQPLLPFVRAGFKGYTKTVEGFLAAKSLLLKNAFEVVGNEMTINPANVQLSAGKLPLAPNLAAELKQGNENQLLITWDNVPSNNSDPHDQVMWVAYDIEKGMAFSQTTGQFRRDEVDKISLAGYTGTLHVYVAFVSAYRTSQSDSVYLGAFVVL